MKSILYFFCFISFVGYSQNPLGNSSSGNAGVGSSIISIYANKGFSNNNGVYKSSFQDKSIKGSKLFFESFNNKCILINTNSKKFSIDNINIDLVSKDFVSKVSNDTLFYFNNVKKAIIDNVVFKKIDGNIYKEILKGKHVLLYEFHNIVLRDEVIDKLTYKVIEPKRWVKNEKLYYMLNNQSLKELKLNKKSVLNIFNADETKLIKNYVKQNSLSYRNKGDLVKLLSYYNTLNL